ncbi:MAG: hypothetical protein AB7R69_00370 [Candidatus Babeliales bacterium]
MKKLCLPCVLLLLASIDIQAAAKNRKKFDTKNAQNLDLKDSKLTQPTYAQVVKQSEQKPSSELLDISTEQEQQPENSPEWQPAKTKKKNQNSFAALPSSPYNEAKNQFDSLYQQIKTNPQQIGIDVYGQAISYANIMQICESKTFSSSKSLKKSKEIYGLCKTAQFAESLKQIGLIQGYMSDSEDFDKKSDLYGSFQKKVNRHRDNKALLTKLEQEKEILIKQKESAEQNRSSLGKTVESTIKQKNTNIMSQDTITHQLIEETKKLNSSDQQVQAIEQLIKEKENYIQLVKDTNSTLHEKSRIDLMSQYNCIDSLKKQITECNDKITILNKSIKEYNQETNTSKVQKLVLDLNKEETTLKTLEEKSKAAKELFDRMVKKQYRIDHNISETRQKYFSWSFDTEEYYHQIMNPEATTTDQN